MKYEACGHYIVVELEKIDEEVKSAGGIVIARDSELKHREQKGTSLATVKHIGVNAWQGHTTNPEQDVEWSPWCCVGDKVMISQYAGQAFPVSDSFSKEEQEKVTRLRVITDTDILVRVDL